MHLRFTSAVLILMILSGCESIPAGQSPSPEPEPLASGSGEMEKAPKDTAQEKTTVSPDEPSYISPPDNVSSKAEEIQNTQEIVTDKPVEETVSVALEAIPVAQPESESSDGDEDIEAPVSDDPVSPRHTEKVTAGWVEWVCFQPETIQLKGKIDTGARTSSLHAYDMAEFERDGKKWVRFHVEHQKTGELLEVERPVVRFLKVIQHEDEPQKRPVVEMEVRIGPFHEKAEFTLIDRSNFVYQVLVGRNFLKGLVLVDCEETFLLGKPCGKLK